MAKATSRKATPDESAKRKAAAAEKKQREEAELEAELTGYLDTAKSVLSEYAQQSQEARENASVYKALVSHLAGVYEEVDKLAKNKGVFESTDLVVQTINDIVKDAKRFAAGDPYLDRTKEFVPAGQNPPYSDVLFVARTVQQFLQRSEKAVLDREKEVARALRQADTVVTALTLWIESKDPEQPTKDEVAERMDGKPVDAWFAAIPPGREAARDYQYLVLEILNYVFNPDLTDGQPEVRTFDGTERRDIIFTNESDEAFWDYVRISHDNIFVMFETKNTQELDAPAINQTATYLGDRVGRLGMIVTRQEPGEAMQRKMFSVWNDSTPRKTILVLADAHLRQLLDVRCKNGSPTSWMQKHYRTFRTAVQ